MADRRIEELARLSAEAPEDGPVAFEYASALDAAGREDEAIPVYRQALAWGLDSEMEYRTLVQLGSSLRVIGDSQGAVTVHRQACSRWPERAANRLFLALALLDSDTPGAAVAEALSVALGAEGDEDLDYYRRALTAYCEQLRSSG